MSLSDKLHYQRRASLKFASIKGEVADFKILIKAKLRPCKTQDEKNDVIKSCLYDAVQNGHLANVKHMFEDLKADPNWTTDIEENTYLMLARISDQPEVLFYLIARGANILAANRKGQTVLDIRPITIFGHDHKQFNRKIIAAATAAGTYTAPEEDEKEESEEKAPDS